MSPLVGAEAVSPHAAVGIVIVAAGEGTRLGAGEPKAFRRVAGRTILERAIRGALGLSRPAQVVVVLPMAYLDRGAALAEDVGGAGIRVVAGGPTRQDSVAAGLAVLGEEPEIVLVHDAARCLTPSAVFDRVADAVQRGGAGVLPVLPVTDTIRRVDAAGAVQETVSRDALRAVQTPQGFPRAELVAAYRHAKQGYTDDGALFTAAGHPVVTVQGAEDSFKITTAGDLRRAEHLLADAQAVRTGIGVDVHATDPEVQLRLGGLAWPGEPGLAGHSDGDVVLHAICDALLSAAGLGDIGSRFGTADPHYAGARSEVFVRETLLLLEATGFAVVNVAVEIVAERPRIGPRRTELETHLSGLVGAPVTIAATTSDRLGVTGRGEGIATVATALLRWAR